MSLTATQEMIFESSLQLWYRDKLLCSSPTQIIDHNCYRVIVGLGEPAIPKLLKELADNPWVGICQALADIVGKVPFEVSPLDYGKINLVASSWILWGWEQGYYDQEMFYLLISKLDKNSDTDEKSEPGTHGQLYCVFCGSKLKLVRSKTEENGSQEYKCTGKDCIYSYGGLLFHHPFNDDVLKDTRPNWKRPAGDSWSLSYIK